MEELFRFMAIRPPEASPAEEPVRIELQSPADGDHDEAPPQLGDIEARLKSYRKHILEHANADPRDTVSNIFGEDDPTNSAAWGEAKNELDKAIIAGKFRDGANRRLLGLHADYLRTMTAVEHVVGRDGATERSLIERILSAPFRIDLVERTNERQQEKDDDFNQRKNQAIDAARETISYHEGLREASEALKALPGSMLTMKVSDPVVQSENEESKPRKSLPRLLGEFIGTVDGSNQFGGMQPGNAILTVKESALVRLSDEAKNAINQTGIDVSNLPYEYVVAELDRHQFKARREIRSVLAPFSATLRSTPIGNTTFSHGAPESPPNSMAYKYSMAKTGYVSMSLPEYEYRPKADEVAAEVKCSPITPSGLGQLLVVRQNLKCYRRSEISHVENVLEGETRKRDHRRSVTTEETFLFEQVTERTEERSLETTDRFEMNSEVERTVKSDMEAKGELNVSGKYGPTVEFEASASVMVSNSKEKSVKVAQSFSQETIEKAVNKVTERVREQRTRRIVEEIEETNHHGFVNDDPGHIIGIYQWLNKIYEAQIFDYGLRQLFDVVVPEPSAFLIAAFQSQQQGSQPRLQRPQTFSVNPDYLSESNYGQYVDRYGAKDVLAPPEFIQTVAKTFQLSDREDKWKDVRHAEGADVTIPPHYEAVHAYMTAGFSGKADEGSSVDIHVDRSWYRISFTGGDTRPDSAMNNQQGTVPVGWRCYKTSSAIATIEIRCRRTAAAMDQWRLETHEKIATAYQSRLAEYNAEQDKLALEATEELEGGNPANNKRIAETELKRAAISIIANQRQLFDLINVDADEVPYVDLAERLDKDPIIRFLEQAFEWENMNYLYYPYFWGRKEPHWKEKVFFQDTDSAFADFIRAGAARVQLAVRPGFEGAVDHFLKTCEPWNGGDLPDISDDLYLPFVDEFAAQLGRPGNEIPVGEPWDVIVPTNLVILREDATLPKWKKQNGDWVEIEPPP